MVGKERKQGRRVSRESKFSHATIDALIDDLKHQRIPLDRITITDEEQPGLRALIRKTGEVSFHSQYMVQGNRLSLKIGNYPTMKIPEARGIAATIEALADKGVDVQKGLTERLIRELKEQGPKWRLK